MSSFQKVLGSYFWLSSCAMKHGPADPLLLVIFTKSVSLIWKKKYFSYLDYVSAIVNWSICAIKLSRCSAMICFGLKKYVSNSKKERKIISTSCKKSISANQDPRSANARPAAPWSEPADPLSSISCASSMSCFLHCFLVAMFFFFFKQKSRFFLSFAFQKACTLESF